jgi:tRNA modification GTPase
MPINATPANPQATTFACLLTPPGRSALAVIGVRGAAAEEAIAAHFAPRGKRPIQACPNGSILFGRWGGEGGEELVVVRRAADDLEVHCHGGTAAATAILADLAAGGCSPLSSQAWLGMVVPGGGKPRNERTTIEAEARLALSHARGPRAVQILTHQLAGSLATAFEELASAKGGTHQDLANRLLAWQPLGLRLTQPWRVVVSGPPNAGKSSLVNALAGFSRSLVSPKAGTTRDVLETRLVLEGWDVVLTDTAGLRENTRDTVEQAGVARAVAAANTADLVIAVTASDAPPATPSVHAPTTAPPRLEVVTKCDLLSDASARDPRVHHTSTRTGEGIEALAALIIRQLIPNVPAPGEAVPFTPRQVAAIEHAAELASR